MHSDLLLMFLADSRLPTSSYAQSAGLEPALLAGMPPARIADYVRSRLATVTRVEAGTAVAARCLALAGSPTGPVEFAWAARTPSPAVREASRSLGRTYRRLALRLWPAAPVLAELEVDRAPSRTRVLGLVAAAAGVGADSLARLVAYDDIQSVLAASLKLAPADPVEVSALGLSLMDGLDDFVVAVRDIRTADDIPASSAPMIEQWAQQHAATERRLFRA